MEKKEGLFQFRNGLKIFYKQPIAAGALMVVVFRRNYGKIETTSKVIVDIGANIGIFSIYSASQISNARIFAYEPYPENYSLLCRNIEVNKLSHRVFAKNMAVAASPGIRNFPVSSSSPTHSFVITEKNCDYINTQCITLKDIIMYEGLTAIDILKLNCEGSEYEILYNCQGETLRCIKNIRMEFHLVDNNRMNGNSMVNFLKKAGFEVVKYNQYDHESGFLSVKKINYN